MLLTVSKRVEFSASRRLHVSDWSDAENLSAFGREMTKLREKNQDLSIAPFTGLINRLGSL